MDKIGGRAAPSGPISIRPRVYQICGGTRLTLIPETQKRVEELVEDDGTEHPQDGAGRIASYGHPPSLCGAGPSDLDEYVDNLESVISEWEVLPAS
jgi:hypothetical protein